MFMKKQLLLFLMIFFYFTTFAKHIVGGEMSYKNLGPGSTTNTTKYRITLRLFRDNDCIAPCATMPPDVDIGIFDNDNGREYPTNLPTLVVLQSTNSVLINAPPPCIVNKPDLNYSVGVYTFEIDLPDNKNGYTASYQTCCRVTPLDNVNNGTQNNGTGATYDCIIPGFQQLNGVRNSSALFTTNVSIICQNKPFKLDFSATDEDQDSLVYNFFPAYNGGIAVSAGNINPAPPPYRSVEYVNGFTFSQPLGVLATIDSKTGIISGIAPIQGRYVVCVLVSEYRNGKLIGTGKKDFIVNVADCYFSGAQLDPKPTTCDGYTVNFSNGNNSPSNQTFYWSFGNPASGKSDTSTSATPTHIYTDTGVFVYKLVVNRGQACADSATQIVKVFPGFNPGFRISPQCKSVGIKFTDITSTVYGVVDTWRWDFGDPSNTGDTTHVQNPTYTYNSVGDYKVSLRVTNSKGCNSTIVIPITVHPPPSFTKTNDTLICSIDTLQLNANAPTGGQFSWTPSYNIIQPNTSSPLVYPKLTSRYYVTLTDNFGCSNIDSVLVKVKDVVSVRAGADTAICSTDTIQLNPSSDALHFKWSPSSSLSNDTAKNPKARPLITTRYYVIANIGKCQSSDSLLVKVTPYPLARARQDTGICVGDTIHLNASGGSIYSWDPGFFLNNPSIPNPVATPERSIRYIVKINDILGCPKPVFDTIFIKVYPISANAGTRDTSIVINQPLQLQGSGGKFYLWTPPTGLNKNTISNPIATVSSDITYLLKVSNEAGCVAYDSIHVRVYKVLPGLYVPNAFTPNKDGRNDIFRPIALGIKKINYFRIFNRWGDLVYSTTEINKGWDGTFKGKPQDPAIYVWMVEGVDYNNIVIDKKGTVVLIR